MKPHSVIIIDDDVDAAASTKDLLELHGISVLGIAKNGKDGLELLQQFTPSKILLDLMMPEYDGFYFLEKVSKNLLKKTMICSGDLSVETQAKLDEFKTCIFFTKPIEFTKIIKEITT